MSSSQDVADQYAKYPYPEAGDDISTWLETFHYHPYDPVRNAAQFWPEGRPRAKLNILVAGCGTMQAAVMAFLNRKCRVTGIDFSSSSIAHEERLRERHKLENLELHAMDLLDVAKLGRQFDYILCSGVLHHLPDPAAGLRALASVLEPAHGAMALMLYGRLARTGIYALQDAFRRMQIPLTPDGVDRVRRLIGRLPRHHPAHWYIENAVELRADAAVVDTFLHRQDVAFSVPDLQAFIETNGLRFQGWVDPAVYERSADVVTGEAADWDRWAVAETLFADMPTHHFLVCRPERDPRHVISFADDGWLGCFPVRHPDLRASEWESAKFVRGQHEFKVLPAEAVLLQEASGTRTVRSILAHAAFTRSPEVERREFAGDFYRRMSGFGHVSLSRVSVD